jgi:hypothetical protein
MKQSVSPGVVAVVVVILVAIIGFAGYRMFGPHHQTLLNAQDPAKGGVRDPKSPPPQKGQSMTSGGMSSGGH